MQATSLRMSRIIRAEREKVYAAWMDPAALVKWWGPAHISCPEAEVDLREGGEYRLAIRETDGSIVWISGQFVTVRPPEEIAYTWTISNLSDPPSLVRVSFLPHAEGTELVLNHERFSSEAIRDMHGMGWAGCLDKLEAYLAV
jgi:uncharacterized protein YndB with AHSA1/START domain